MVTRWSTNNQTNKTKKNKKKNKNCLRTNAYIEQTNECTSTCIYIYIYLISGESNINAPMRNALIRPPLVSFSPKEEEIKNHSVASHPNCHWPSKCQSTTSNQQYKIEHEATCHHWCECPTNSKKPGGKPIQKLKRSGTPPWAKITRLSTSDTGKAATLAKTDRSNGNSSTAGSNRRWAPSRGQNSPQKIAPCSRQILDSDRSGSARARTGEVRSVHSSDGWRIQTMPPKSVSRCKTNTPSTGTWKQWPDIPSWCPKRQTLNRRSPRTNTDDARSAKYRKRCGRTPRMQSARYCPQSYTRQEIQETNLIHMLRNVHYSSSPRPLR